MKSKLSFFRNSILNINCDFLFLSKTWLCCYINDLELDPANFIVFEADRIVNLNLSCGGGVN